MKFFGTKVLLAFSALLMFVLLNHSADAAVVKITTCQELQNMKNNLAGSYALNNDIDCTDTRNWNGGRGFLPVGVRDYSSNGIVDQPFLGQLDGQGHAIKNLYIDGTISGSNVGMGTTNPNVAIGTTNPNGLFGTIKNSSISKVRLNNVVVKGAGSSGGLVGEIAYDGGISTIDNVVVDGTVTGNWAGGLIGVAYQQTITESSANVDVTGRNFAGGLVGYAGPGVITKSFTNGTVRTDGTIFNDAAGGLVGYLLRSNISDSYSNSNVIGRVNSHVSLGGLVGVGFGYNGEGSINRSYSTGVIRFEGVPSAYTFVGGLLGRAESNMTVISSYWNKESSGQTKSVGSPDANGQTTAQMKQQATFTAFDFLKTWVIVNDQGYPRLRSEFRPQSVMWDAWDAVSRFVELMTAVLSPEDAIRRSGVNWTDLNSAHVGVSNWDTFKEASRPKYWDDRSLPIGFINWEDLVVLSRSAVNWSDFDIIGRSGINWMDFGGFFRSGANWLDWLVSTRSGINWKDISVLSRSGLNWENIGVTNDNVNWSSLNLISRRNINWSEMVVLSREGTNWNDINVLNQIHMTPAQFKVLQSVGVKAINDSPVEDITSPVISRGSPSGSLPVGTLQTIMTVSTDELATCRYDTTSKPYNSMTHSFASTGHIEHSELIRGLTATSSVVYYVRCQDQSENHNQNTVDYLIKFCGSNADCTAPTVPGNLRVTAATATSITLAWDAASDEKNRVAYRIFRNGTMLPIGTINRSVVDRGLNPGTTYVYTVLAYDSSPARNKSVQSEPIMGQTR